MSLTARSARPIAWLAAVNDQQVGSRASGFPDRTRVTPGNSQLTVYCTLPSPAGRPAGAEPPAATIRLSYEFKAGSTYLLRCERNGNTVRAWIQPEGAGPAPGSAAPAAGAAAAR